MSLTIISNVVKTKVWHKDYNLMRMDNLRDLPPQKAVFGIFGIVGGEPVNCRYIGQSENLQLSVQQLFDAPEGEGLKKFMQGPWIRMLQYSLMPGSSGEERTRAMEEWRQKYDPRIDADGEYPGYY